MNKKKLDGFTLSELLIVVAIIGVLVSISIPLFQNKLKRSAEVVNKANIRTARAAGMEAYYRGMYSYHTALEKGTYTAKKNPDRNPYNRYQLMRNGGNEGKGGAFYYFLDSNILGYQWYDKFTPDDYTYEKKNGVYSQILVECYEENGELVIKTKPYIDDKGKVRLAFAEQGTPYEQAEHNTNCGWDEKFDKKIEKKWNNDLK